MPTLPAAAGFNNHVSAVSLIDMRAAMAAVEPTAMSEIYVITPKVRFCSGVANEC